MAFARCRPWNSPRLRRSNQLLRLSSFAAAFSRRQRGEAQPVGHVVSMKKAEFQLRGVADPRLAVHVHLQPAGMAVVDRRHPACCGPIRSPPDRSNARNGAESRGARLRSGHPHRRQVIQLANRLPRAARWRLERLARLRRGTRRLMNLRLLAG